MKKSLKKIFLIAITLIVAGCLIFLGGVIAIKGDFRKASTLKFETRKQTVREAFTELSIDAGASDVTFYPSLDGTCSVSYMEEKNFTYEVVVQDGKLTVAERDTRKWYQQIGIYFGGDLEIRVYLPQTAYENLTVVSDSGDVTLPTGIFFTNVSVKSDSGDVECRGSVGGLSVQTSSGDIELEGATLREATVSVTSGEISVAQVKVENSLSLHSGSGEIEVEDSNCGALTIAAKSGNVDCENVLTVGETNIKTSSGNIRLIACDGQSYTIQAGSGNVRASFLTAKIFDAKSSSGNVKAPVSTVGGVCQVRTSSGNIRLEIYG